MPTYNVRLKGRRDVAEGTTAFSFEKPEGFQFEAGQFVVLALIDPPKTDAEGNTRNFSIASAPFEEDLMVATRMRNTAFKDGLKVAALGTEVKVAGPFGLFTLHEDPSRPAVFLVGGIGITPFRSMILQAARSRLAHRLFLFYSNRRPEDAAFLDELQQSEKENPNYQFIGTMTEIQKSQRPWQGETGYITEAMLENRIKDMAAPIYYSAGPPGMVRAMQTMLSSVGVGDDDIRTEEFSGY